MEYDVISWADIDEAIEILNEIYNAGNEPLQILTNLSEYFKNLLIVKTCRKELLPELTGLNEPQITEMLKQKDLLETQQIVFLLERITYYIKEVKLATNQHLWLEVGMIDFANMTENTTLLELQNRVKALEAGGVSVGQPVQRIVQPAPVSAPVRPVPQKAAETEPVTRPAPVPPAESPAAAAPKQEQQDDFTPPPISRKPDGNDINTLWQALLVNIKSPATKALLHLATPVKIASDEVIITFKNEKLVSQINDTNKKQMLVEAANTMFNQQDSKIVVRLPQSGDANLAASIPASVSEEKKKIAPQIKKEGKSESLPSIPQQPEIANEEPPETIPDNGVENSAEAAETKTSQPKKSEREETDQEKMVLELFDGKYIE